MSTKVAPGEIVIPGVRAQPKYATRRDPNARTDGARIAKIAAGIGKPGMPWQQYVWDVATERDAFGLLKYEIVFVTVPRQSGKTTLVGPVQIDRCIMTPNIKTFYTAQTGKDARSRFNDLVKLVKASPMEAVTTVRYSAGDEGILFPNGSALKIFAPTENAIHGETPPLVTFDEIWHYDELLGDAMLEDAVIPAQLTLAGRRQIWLISTAGTAESTFMKKWVERGRKGWPKMAYIEFALADGADPYDPEAIADFHPAVGYTVTVEDLLATALGALQPDGTRTAGLSRAKWLRSYCNVWTEAINPVMSKEDWAALDVSPNAVPRRSEIAVTYEVAPDNECAAIMASWRDTDGTPCVRVLHAAPGTTWLVELLVALYRQWKPLVLGADDGGPTRRVTDELRRLLDAPDTKPENSAVKTTGPRDFNTACDAYLTYATTANLRHDGSKTLANGMAHLALKELNGVKSFSRQASTGPIAGHIAGAVGIWLYDHREKPIGKPVIRF